LKKISQKSEELKKAKEVKTEAEGELTTLKAEAESETDEETKLQKQERVKEQEKKVEECQAAIEELTVSVQALEHRKGAIDTQKKEDAEEASKMLAMARSRSRNMAGMKAAVNKQKQDYKKMLEENKMIKPVFKAVAENPPADGCFTDYWHAKSFMMREGSTGTPNFFGRRRNAQSSENAENNESLDRESSKSEMWCIAFQSMYAEIQNDLWSLIQDSLTDPNWYIEGMEPGTLWKQGGYGARFVPVEALFVQKFAFYSTSKKAARSFRSSSSSNPSSTAGSQSGDENTSDQRDNEPTATKEHMQTSSDGKSVIAPNLNLKVVLVKPIFPAPLRGGHNDEAKQMPEHKILTSAYAERHLGRPTFLKLQHSSDA
jgi:hypothetical protein